MDVLSFAVVLYWSTYTYTCIIMYRSFLKKKTKQASDDTSWYRICALNRCADRKSGVNLSRRAC